MWPLDRMSVTEYLRIGRHSVDRWAGSSLTLSLVDSCALPADSGLDADNLLPALRALYPNRPQAVVTVLLESAWLPLLLVEAGPALWTSAQVEPLLRHRLDMIHGTTRASTSGWDLRVDYRPGERFALGYGMPPLLKQALADTGDALGLEWAALLPAFAWGLDRLRPTRHWSGRSGWWVWPEQDRLLVARITSNRVVALNAGASCSDDPAQITHLVDVERLRCGLPASVEPIGAATWAPARFPTNPTDRVGWIAIAGRSQAHADPGTVPSPSSAHP